MSANLMIKGTLASLLVISAIACTKSSDDAATESPVPTAKEQPAAGPEAKSVMTMVEADAVIASVGMKFKPEMVMKRQKDGSDKLVAVWDMAFLRAFRAEASEKGELPSREQSLDALKHYIQAASAQLEVLKLGMIGQQKTEPQGKGKTDVSKQSPDSFKDSDDDRVNQDAEVKDDSYDPVADEDGRVNKDAEIENSDMNNNSIVVAARLEAAQLRASLLEKAIQKQQEPQAQQEEEVVPETKDSGDKK